MPCQPDEPVFSPRLAKNCRAVRAQDASNLPCRALDIQVVEDRIPPNSIERPTREWQAIAVGTKEINRSLVILGSRPGLGDIAVRQIECSHAGASLRHDDGRHGMPAAKIEYVEPREVAKLIKRRSDPGFVVEVLVGVHS